MRTFPVDSTDNGIMAFNLSHVTDSVLIPSHVVESSKASASPLVPSPSISPSAKNTDLSPTRRHCRTRLSDASINYISVNT